MQSGAVEEEDLVVISDQAFWKAAFGFEEVPKKRILDFLTVSLTFLPSRTLTFMNPWICFLQLPGTNLPGPPLPPSQNSRFLRRSQLQVLLLPKLTDQTKQPKRTVLRKKVLNFRRVICLSVSSNLFIRKFVFRKFGHVRPQLRGSQL
jgi:hypothetical protein